MSKNIPTKINNYNVYNEGEKLLGVGDELTLPDFEATSETVSGAGILGEIDDPTIGHFGNMQLEIPFRTLDKEATNMMDQTRAVQLTIRGAAQEIDSAGNIVPNVRQAGNGCFVLCQEAEAAGIAHNGTVYHLLGREALEGAESVILEKTDAGDLVKRIQDTAKDVDAMNVDQELRLTLLEMGISSTDAQAF